LYQPTKFGLLKKRLYSPSQSPFRVHVSWKEEEVSNFRARIQVSGDAANPV
jgi:hypothetical protein